MKLNELKEMTMREPAFHKLNNLQIEIKSVGILTGNHIANIENYKVLQDGIYYSLWDDTTLVAVCSLSNSANEVDDVYVNSHIEVRRFFQ